MHGTFTDTEIVVTDVRREDAGDAVRAACTVRSGGLPETLIFEAPRRNAPALDTGEPNWAAVALLYPAMSLRRARP